MKTSAFIILLLFIGKMAFSQNQVPVISNVSVEVINPAQQVKVTFDLADAEGDLCDIKFLVSNNAGLHYTAFSGTLSGDVGSNVSPGMGKEIVWNFNNINDIYAYSIRLVADDRQLPDIQEIVNQVDSVRLRTDLYNLEGVRHYS